MRWLVQAVIQLVARACMRVWFRRLEVVGRDRMPASGPLLVVASHFNGLLDPALIAAIMPRVPRFLAKATLWRFVALGRFLDIAGVLPVHRASEGDTASNERVFAACYTALAEGQAVAMFPEGRTHDELRVLTLRTGAARLALGARRAGAHGLVILPVGLVYLGKGRARGRALVRIGEPIDLDAAIPDYVDPGQEDTPENREAVRRLTDDIARRLADAALDFSGPATAVVAAEAAAVALRPQGAPHEWEPPLDALERLSRRVAAAPPRAQSRVLEAFALYRDSLSLLGVTDADVAAGDLSPAAWRLRLAQLPLVLAATPAAAVGTVVNALPAGIVWAVGRPPLQPMSRGTAKLAVALVAFPATWGVVHRYLRGHHRGRHPALATVALGPGCGLAAIALVDRVRALRSAREGMRRLRSYPSLLPALRSEREEVAAAVEAAAGDHPRRPWPDRVAHDRGGAPAGHPGTGRPP